jgi:lipopolysaccharide transport system permease protein
MDDVVVIEAGRGERHYCRDLWRYRELFQVLAWRDLSVRYCASFERQKKVLRT